MSEEMLAGQIDYYRRRAGEYDVTAYGDVAAARTRIARLVAELRPAGRVLEIACGTGLWTEALAQWADEVTAIDAAPEAVAIARDRGRGGNVRFEAAGVFGWEGDPAVRFDVIFFSAWLSHVPDSKFESFWALLRELLAAGGRVLFIDEHVDERGKEAYLPGRDDVVERRGRTAAERRPPVPGGQEPRGPCRPRTPAGSARLGRRDRPGRARLGPRPGPSPAVA